MKKPYIIAEVGFNHEGNMDVARDMIQSAAEAGADAVKFQTFQAVDLALPSAPHFELIKPAEMTFEDLIKLKSWSDEASIDFMSTPFSPQALLWLVEVGVSTIKIASMDCVNQHLLAAAAGTGKRLILSTGMATLEEIRQTLGFLDEQGSGEVVLLHCISNYPAKAGELNMASLNLLKRTFGRPVGYSDHHHSPQACLVAAVLGAEVIETHFTLFPDREDGDHGHSLDPDQLRTLVGDIEAALTMIGSEADFETRADREHASQYRRGLYAGRDLKRGEMLQEEDLLFCRPVSELSPSDVRRLKGRALCRDVVRYASLTAADVEGIDG